MAGIVLNSYTESINVQFNDYPVRGCVEIRIKKSAIRFVVKKEDGVSVEIVFDNGELYEFPYVIVDEIDGYLINSQDGLYNKMNAVLGFNSML